ncbi:MAG: hypothetical protein ABIO55_00865 [Ginsengibacter sp.]
MKKQPGKMDMIAILLTCSIVGAICMSFQDTPKIKPEPLPGVQIDTPKKNSVHVEIDMRDLKKALEEINIELKGINWDKITKEIEITMNSIDVDKIKKDVNQSLQSIDWEKIKADVNNSINDINLDEIKINIQKTADEIKANINSGGFEKNIKNMKKADAGKIKKEIKKAQKEIEKNKDQLKNNIDKMKDDIKTETTYMVETPAVKNTQLPEKDRLFFLI